MGRQSRSKLPKPAPNVTPPEAPRPTRAAAGPPGSAPTRAKLLAAAALAVLTLAVYAQVARQTFVNFDDNLYVTENVMVQRGLTLDGLRWAVTSMDVNWHPVTWLTYMFDVDLFGVDAGALKLSNAAWHLANAILLFLLLSRITGAFWRSAIVAALFAVHPLRVESVAWISERKDVVSGFFFLLTLLLYAAWVRRRSALLYAAVCACFLAGLAAKQMLVTLPFVLLLLDYWPLQRLDLRDRRSVTAAVVEKIPLFGIMLFGIVMSIVGQKAIGAVRAIDALPLGPRLLNALASYGRYLWKTFVPSGLAIPYPYHPVDAVTLVLSLLAVGGITAAALAFRDSQRALFTGWFWFVGTLVPVIGIMQIGGQAMADRYTYIPHMGLLTAVVWLAAGLVRGRGARQLVGAAAVVAIVALAFLAFRQTARWRDSGTLFAHSLAVTGDSYVAHANLAAALAEKSDHAAALEHFRAAAGIDPESPEARAGIVTSLIELARLDRARGDDPAAAAKLAEAEKFAGDDRTRAALAMAGNDTGKAIELYKAQTAGARTPDEAARAHNDLGASLASAGRDEEAIAEYRKAIQIAPRLYDTRMNLGALLSRLERNEEAVVQFSAAASIQPGQPEPYVYLALCYSLMKRYPEALGAARRAWAIDPKASNLKLTNAIRMPFKETNFQEFMQFLQQNGGR